MRHTLVTLAAGLAAAPFAAAQHSLIVSPDADFVIRGLPGTSALGAVDDQESILVTPDAQNPYEARPFRTFSVINTMHGDGDLDGDLNDTDKYGDLNCLFVKNRLPNPDTGPFEPGNLYMSCSFNTTAAVATANSGVVTVRDGDVWRARNGTLEFFITETQILDALGDSTADIDIDGMCQDQMGSLWFTFWDATNSVAGGSLLDGDLMHIPASAISYDANGNVQSVLFGSAVLWASESQMDALAANSGTFRQDGTAVTRAGDLSGLNIDVGPGAWQSPQDPNLIGPNLIFTSNFLENFDNIWTTANAGSAAVINGVTMGYTSGPADGSKLGIGQLASGQDAINAMVVVPAQTGWIAVDSPLAGGSSQGQFTLEFGRLEPNSPLGVLVSLWSMDLPGGFVPAVPLPSTIGLVGGNPWLEALNPQVAFTIMADANGYATLQLPDPGTVTPGVDLIIQGVGQAFGNGGNFSATGTASVTF